MINNTQNVIAALFYFLANNMTLCAENYQHIKESQSKPFSEFCQAVVSSPPLALPSPKEGSFEDQRISELIWNRLLSHQFFVTRNENSENKVDLSSVHHVYEWLLKKPCYTNLLMAAFIKEAVGKTLVKEVVNNQMEASQALKILKDLKSKFPNVSVIMQVVANEVPESNAVAEFILLVKDNQLIDILWAADKLAHELNEVSPCPLHDLRIATRPAGFLAFLAQAGTWSFGVEGLLEFASKGGNLNLDSKRLAMELKKIIPDFFQKKNPLTSNELYGIELVEMRDLIIGE